jgi:hypothetical protein
MIFKGVMGFLYTSEALCKNEGHQIQVRIKSKGVLFINHSEMVALFLKVRNSEG